jgi:hypothetical protein
MFKISCKRSLSTEDYNRNWYHKEQQMVDLSNVFHKFFSCSIHGQKFWLWNAIYTTFDFNKLFNIFFGPCQEILQCQMRNQIRCSCFSSGRTLSFFHLMTLGHWIFIKPSQDDFLLVTNRHISLSPYIFIAWFVGWIDFRHPVALTTCPVLLRLLPPPLCGLMIASNVCLANSC